MDPLFQNYSTNASLCMKCKDHYMNLSQSFVAMRGDENSMCMDAVDLVSTHRFEVEKKICSEII